MRLFSRVGLLLIGVSGLVLGQDNWEVGAAGGYGVSRNVGVNAGTVSGSAGFQPGVAAGAVLGNRMNRWISGEARYTFQSDDLRVSSGSAKATAQAQSHAMHYDLLVHAKGEDARVRPFLAGGAGLKVYRGTGQEPVYQPLSNLVVLTHASELKPLISLGGGVKFKLSRRVLFRLDFRDYATPLPNKLLAAPPGSRTGGWIHNFVALAGISSAFGQ